VNKIFYERFSTTLCYRWKFVFQQSLREFMFCREVGLSLWSTLSFRINTKIIGNMNWS